MRSRVRLWLISSVSINNERKQVPHSSHNMISSTSQSDVQQICVDTNTCTTVTFYDLAGDGMFGNEW